MFSEHQKASGRKAARSAPPLPDDRPTGGDGPEATPFVCTDVAAPLGLKPQASFPARQNAKQSEVQPLSEPAVVASFIPFVARFLVADQTFFRAFLAHFQTFKPATFQPPLPHSTLLIPPHSHFIPHHRKFSDSAIFLLLRQICPASTAPARRFNHVTPQFAVTNISRGHPTGGGCLPSLVRASAVVGNAIQRFNAHAFHPCYPATFSICPTSLEKTVTPLQIIENRLRKMANSQSIEKTSAHFQPLAQKRIEKMIFSACRPIHTTSQPTWNLQILFRPTGPPFQP
jgi:hypothetical protein